MKFLIISLIIGLGLIIAIEARETVISCYYGSWAVQRKEKSRVAIDDLDPYMCTHIFYAFIGVNDDGQLRLPNEKNDIVAFEKLRNMKKFNPRLKILISTGGWSQGSEIFSQISQDANMRDNFAKNVFAFLKQHKLDGLDIDWEYPTERGGEKTDKDNFVELLKSLHKVFKKRSFILTAAVGPGQKRRVRSYDVRGISKYVNYIHLMAYDLHGNWNNITGHNAPLYGSMTDNRHNVEFVITDWLAAGVSPAQIVLGVPFYGRSFTLKNVNSHKAGAPSSGAGKSGKYTRQSGSMSYLEICENIREGWYSKWDKNQVASYIYKENQWISYDNARALKMKVDMIRRYGLAGVTIWSVDQDDIFDTCEAGRYPLLTTIFRHIDAEYIGDHTYVTTTEHEPEFEEITEEPTVDIRFPDDDITPSEDPPDSINILPEELPSIEEPPKEDIVIEETPLDQPSFVEPSQEESVTEETPIEQPTSEDSTLEEPVIEENLIDQPSSVEPSEEATVTEDISTEQTVSEDAPKEEPSIEETPIEEPPSVEDPKDESITDATTNESLLNEASSTETPSTGDNGDSSSITIDSESNNDNSEELKIPQVNAVCTIDGEYYHHPKYCKIFFRCASGLIHQFTCGDGTAFDITTNTCAFIDRTDCGNRVL